MNNREDTVRAIENLKERAIRRQGQLSALNQMLDLALKLAREVDEDKDTLHLTSTIVMNNLLLTQQMEIIHTADELIEKLNA